MVVRVAPAGRPFKNTVVGVSIGAGAVVRYETQVNSSEFVPSQATIRWSGGAEDSELQDVAGVEYVWNGTSVQAWEEDDSFVNLCLDHGGEEVTVLYYPLDDISVGFEVTTTLPHPRIGGAAKAYNEFTWSQPCSRPERVTTAAPAVTP